MAAADLMPVTGALAAAGVVVLRLSWSRSARSPGMNAVGWAALVLALAFGAAQAGAWGMAVATSVAIATALLLLAVAVFAQPRWRRAAQSGRRAEPVVETGSRTTGGSPGRGLATFVIAGLSALIASVLVALSARLALLTLGAGEANANPAVLALVALVWPILVFTLLMLGDRKRQLTLVGGISAAALVPLLLAGWTV